VTAPLHGTVTLHENGFFTYTPDSGYQGRDTFSYKASDDVSSSAVKTVTVDVYETAVQKPTAPKDFRATEISTHSLVLNWTDTSDNEEGFVIYRDGKLICNINPNQMHELITHEIEPNTTYTFVIRSKNAAGLSDPVSLQVTTKDIVTPPDAPTKLKAKAIEKTSVRLEWKDNADNESAYEIYQNGTKVKTVSAGCHCTVINNLKPCESYTFTVKAVNKLGSSGSNTIVVDTLCDIVAPENHTPVAKNLSAALNVNYSVSLPLHGTDADGDSLSYIVLTQPHHGTLTGTAPNLTYIPNT